MPRTPRALALIALAVAVGLLTACTPAADNSNESSTSPSGRTTVTAASPSPTPTTARTTKPTVPPVDPALLQEATDVFHAVSVSMRGVSFDGGFTPDAVPPAYPKHLMGSQLIVAIVNANAWHEAGYRRVSGVEELVDIQPYPAMYDGSLVALSGCRKQTDVRFEVRDNGSGWPGGDEQQVAFFKRDTDGLLKIFHISQHDVTSCDKRSADPALVAEASTIYGTVLGLLDTHLVAGGLNQADYPTSGFAPYLGHQARAMLLLDLELARVSDQTTTRDGPTRFGRVTEWPYARRGSIVALTSCLDRSTTVRTTMTGNRYRDMPRIFFAYFTRDPAGTLRLSTIDSFSVDVCP